MATNPPDPASISSNEELISLIRQLVSVTVTGNKEIKAAVERTRNAPADSGGGGASRPSDNSPRAPQERLPAAPVAPPPAVPRDIGGGGGGSAISELLNVAKTAFAQLGRQVQDRAGQARADDYIVGQMSRRYVDQGSQSLGSYRQRIHDLGIGTGMSFQESFGFANMAGRYGTGTYSAGSGRTSSTGGIGSFDQGQQLKYATQAAFNLGMDRSQLQSTLTTLGSAGAVGAAGAAGGQKQDYRQFAVTMAETLASGRLFDRMDDVMKSIGGLAQEISQRGGIVDAQQLATALSSANLAALSTGSARTQERAPQMLADINRLSAANMKDPMMFGAYMQQFGAMDKTTGRMGIKDLMKFQETMSGGDVVAQSQVFAQRFSLVGGNINELIGNDKRASQLTDKSATAVYEMSQRMGMTPDALVDTLRISAGVGGQQGAEQISQLRSSAQYQQIVSKGTPGAQQLYARAAMGNAGDLQSLIASQLDKMKTNIPANILRTGPEAALYKTFEAQKASLAAGGNTETARKAILDAIAAAPKTAMLGENSLDAAQVQQRELSVAIDNLASSVEQLSAALGVDRTKADFIRRYAGQGAGDYADPNKALTMGTDGNRLRAGAFGGGAILANKLQNDKDGNPTSLTGMLAHYVAGKFLGKGAETAATVAEQTAANGSGGLLSKTAGFIARGAGRVASVAKVASIAGLGGMALDMGGDLLKSAGHDQLGGWANVLGRAASYGATGATVGSFLGPWGTAIGGIGGGLYGAYEAMTENGGANARALLPSWMQKAIGVTPEPTTSAIAGGPDVTGATAAELQFNKATMDQLGYLADMNTSLDDIKKILENQASSKTNDPTGKRVGGGSDAGSSDVYRSLMIPATGKQIDGRTGARGGSGGAGGGGGSGGAGGSGGSRAGGSRVTSGGAGRPPNIPAEWMPAIREAARVGGVDEAFIIGTMMQESGGNPNAVSEAGAGGLMQVMPDTARAANPELRGKSDDEVRQYLRDPINNFKTSGLTFAMKRREGVNTISDHGQGFTEADQYEIAERYFGKGDVNTSKYAKEVMDRVKAYRQAMTAPQVGGGSDRFIPVLKAGANTYGSSVTGQWYDNYHVEWNDASGRHHVRDARDIGADFDATSRDKIVAPTSGTIVSVQDTSGNRDVALKGLDPNGDKYDADYGNSIMMQDAEGTLHRLSHMSSLAGLKAGQKVDAGTLLGMGGRTGAATGEHLDWEGWQKDANGVWQLLNMQEWVNGNWEFAPHRGNTDADAGRNPTEIDASVAARNTHGKTWITGKGTYAGRSARGQQGGGADSGSGGVGGGEDSGGQQQLEVVIKLEQDSNGGITGKIVSSQRHIIAFNNQDQVAQTYAGGARRNGPPIWVVNPRVDN